MCYQKEMQDQYKKFCILAVMNLIVADDDPLPEPENCAKVPYCSSITLHSINMMIVQSVLWYACAYTVSTPTTLHALRIFSIDDQVSHLVPVSY